MLERLTRETKKQKGKELRKKRIKKARGNLSDIPEINNYDAAYYHYALNIVEAASKT